jgi:hypothetical protein
MQCREIASAGSDGSPAMAVRLCLDVDEGLIWTASMGVNS